MTQGSGSSIDNLLETLSEESAQDAAAFSNSDSYLSSANALNMVRREKEYIDPEKQYVRGRWVVFAEELRTKLLRPLTYLTLPAYYRFDVTMMLEKNLLSSRRVEGREIMKVAAFETDPGKFARMSGTSPAFGLLGNCALEEAITNPQNPYHADLSRMFPFDMINFDLTTSLTPKHEGPYSRVMQALEEVMRRQATRHEEWVLFLTFRNSEADWEQTALSTFITNLQENLDRWPAVRDAFVGKLGASNAKDLQGRDPETAIVQSVGKWLVDRAHVYGQSCEKSESYRYRRYAEGVEPYVISKLLMRFKRGTSTRAVIPTKAIVQEAWMEADLIRCIDQNRHKDVESILLAYEPKIEELRQETERLVSVFNVKFTEGT